MPTPAGRRIESCSARTFERVWVNHEGVIFRGGRIFPESFVAGSAHAQHYRRVSRYAWFLAKNYWLRRGGVDVASGLWAIDNYSPGNYHHWLIDVLPRLLAAEEHFPQEDTLLLPRYYRGASYIPFTLRAFSQIKRFGWIGARGKARINRLAFVARPAADQMPARLREVARRVGELAGRPGDARRIYFSRSDAARRRAVNEDDVVRVLRAHEFEIVRIDPDKPWQQVRAARGADLIAGVHGAALTNLIFMPPGGRVLELRHSHDDVFFEAYRPVAEMLGVVYHRQDCEVVQDASGTEINNVDLRVDLDLLRENLDAIA